MSDKKHIHTCPKCGNVGDFSNFTVVKQFGESPHCFSCCHWNQMLEGYLSGERLVINGSCYTPAFREGVPKKLMGFGGAEYRIRRQDGTEFDCNDLWCQGTVPECWAGQMPNNAVFVPTDKDRQFAAHYGYEIPETF